MHDDPQQHTIEDIAQCKIKEAEVNKANIFPPKGNENPAVNFYSTVHMDQDYLVIGNHIDTVLQNKIMEENYVDFSKLIPRDRIVTEEEKVELIIKNN